MKKKSTGKGQTLLGEISESVVYPLPVFEQLSGLGKHSMCQLRRQGLATTRLGNRVYVRGRDFIEFLATRALEK